MPFSSKKRRAKWGYAPRTCTSEVNQFIICILRWAKIISSGLQVSG